MAINVLPENIANQIAAGEVINRPSSVVKELMENSIDANSTNITLIVNDAGRSLIEVIDNGCGMNEEDAKKCFLAHATSKIQTEDDLRKLTTMGFRGEALASIAAISQVEMRTKQLNSDLAEEILIEGGEIKSISKTTANVGTDIKVKNIFFNVPARRNFLKSDSIENTHITNTFLRIALIYNDIVFTFIKDGNVIYKLEKASFKKRIKDIFGEKFNKNLLPINEKTDIVEIEGFISTPDLTKKNKNDRYFFVNKRFMRNHYFANAVDRAYTNIIKPNSYPIFFIHLIVNPKNIDVNIHPTKTEINFIDDKIIYSILNAAVRKTLGQSALNNTLDFENKPIDFPNNNASYNKKSFNYSSSFNPFAKNYANPSFDFKEKINNVKVQTEISFNNQNEPSIYNSEVAFNTDDSKKELYKTAFQFLNKYIIVIQDNEILVINQAKASIKIIYEFLKGNIALILPSEKLLLPYIHRFSSIEIISLKNNLRLLEDIGFEFSIKEDNSVEFNKIPKDMTTLGAMNIIMDVINEEVHLEDRILIIAEKLSIKEGKVLLQNEIQVLIKQLQQINNPEFLPMNERILLRIDRNYLNNLFF